MEKKTEREKNNNPMVIPVLLARQEKSALPSPPRRSEDEAKQPIGVWDKPSE